MGSGCFLRCAGVAHLGKLIDLYSYPVRTAMRFLLADKTTGENIIWATNTYERYGDGYRQDNQITPELISGVYANLIQPRILKAEEEQAARTKSKAEVFTPSWVVCYMNNKCDDDWFGRENVFNTLSVCIAVHESEKLKKHKAVCNAAYILAALIILATMFLKQHSVLDVFGAVIMAYVLYKVVYEPEKKMIPQLSKQKFSKQKRIAAHNK